MATEEKKQHLEFIQNIITRMNTNSFQIKGIAIAVGDFYGTHINDKLNELKVDYTGIFKELVQEGKNGNLSVLELEIIESLKNTNQKKIFFIQEITSDDNRIKKLIARIKKSDYDSNVKIIYYNNYEDILFRLQRYFENKFKQEIDKFDLGQQYRNQVYANKTRYSIFNESTQKIHSELDNYINNDSQKVFVLSGVEGSGKRTALLQWVQKQEKENSNNSKTKIISVFTGTGENISDEIVNILYRIYNKVLANRGEDEKTLLNQFAQFTLKLSAQFSKSIIVIDKINHIEFTSDWTNKYWWLNKQLENNVKIIISTTDNIEGAHFENHLMPYHNISELVEAYLRKEGKEQIINDFREKLAFTKNGLPISARLLCSEICMTAKFDTIDEILNGYSKYSLSNETDIVNLYKEFLKRLEKRKYLNSSVVRDLCSYIYYSENGLSEITLQELIKDTDESEVMKVAVFYSLLRHEFKKEDNADFTIYLRRAVKELYIDNNRNKEIEYRIAMIKKLEKYDEELLNNEELQSQLVESGVQNMSLLEIPMNLTERAYQIYKIKDKQKMYDLLSVKANANELRELNHSRFLEYMNLIEDMKKVGFWGNILKKIKNG